MKISEFISNRVRNWKTTSFGITSLFTGLALWSGDAQIIFTAFAHFSWPDWSQVSVSFLAGLGSISSGWGLIFGKDAAVSGTAITPTPTVVPPVKG